MIFRKLIPYLIGVPLGLATWALIAVVVRPFRPPDVRWRFMPRGGPQAALAAIIAAGG